MQLSAPILPLDPTANLSSENGFSTATGRNDSRSRGDFGAILRAESHNDSGRTAAPHRNARDLRHDSRKASTEQRDAGDLSTESSPERSYFKERSGTADTDTSSDSVSISEPPAALNASPAPTSSDLDLGLNATVPTDMDEDRTVLDTEASSAGAAPVVPGQPFLGEMLHGKARAGIRAYGLNLDGTVSPSDAAREHALFMTRGSTAPGAVSSAPSTGAPNTFGTIPGWPVGDPVLPLPTASSDLVDPALAAALGAGISSSPTSGGPQEVSAQTAATSAGTATVRTDVTEFLREAALVGPGGDTAASSLKISDEAHLETVAADVEAELNTPPLAPTAVAATASNEAVNLSRSAATSAAAEKIAAHLSRVADRIASTDKSSQRVSLHANAEKVATSNGRIGINAAKPEALMPVATSTPTPTQVAVENHSINSMPLSLDSLVKEGAENAGGQVTQAARRAVEAVLSIADQTVATDQRTVRLQFTVGGEELAVRVELRGERVHTTFRTDSPDLRSALAHEWQSVAAAQNGGRTQRLADPVFSSNSSGSGNGMSSDSGAAHQRDSSSRHPQATSEELFGVRRALATTQAVSASAPVPPAIASSGLNPLRLHTFA
jgi:hypothetical protein